MSVLRSEVQIAVGLREIAAYEPVDTRPECPGCGQRKTVMVTTSQTFREQRFTWSECVACWQRGQA